VNLPRWRSKDWPQKPANEISDEELWQFKNKKRQVLVDMVKEKTGFDLDPNALTVVWARRFAPYKRPEMLFNDMKRLAALLNKKDQPIQFVMAGNAGYDNEEGKKLLEEIMTKMGDKSLHGRAVYVPGYSIEIAHKLIEGADLWLNTPIRGKEASATSGMKSGLNGTLQFSVSDGWIEEVDWSDKGWVLPSEDSEEALYGILENDIRNMFYDREGDIPKDWVTRIRNTAKWVECNYTTERMLTDYIEKLYFPR